MLTNPYRQRLPTHEGSRILAVDLGVIGVEVDDPWNNERSWTVVRIYEPLPKALGGLRFKLEDQKGFVTFCNQRDLEVLLGLGEPGKYCIWADQDYVGKDDPKWFGLCTDEFDLLDDLYDREIVLRHQNPGILEWGMTITRRVHLSRGRDVEMLEMMLFDCDPLSGLGPDPRFETLTSRWSQVGKDKLTWQHLPISFT